MSFRIYDPRLPSSLCPVYNPPSPLFLETRSAYEEKKSQLKQCRVCQEWKTGWDFASLSATCKICARERDRVNRLKRKGSEGVHTDAEWNALCSFYGNQCLRCGSTDRPITRDHIVPIFKGGADDISNIQPLCRSCNSSKGIKTTDYRPSLPDWIKTN